MGLISKEDARWGEKASFAGTSFDSDVTIVSRILQYFKYTFLAYLEVTLWFVFALYCFK